MSNVTASQVRVWNSRFEASHGRAPRGRGSWMFDTSRHQGTEGGVCGWDCEVFQSHWNATFTEARRAAQEWAAAKGFTEVWTCP